MNAKRAFDIIAATIGLIVFAPALIIIALLVRLDSPGPSIFAQERVGRGGAIFKIFKFRTMIVSPESHAPQITVGQDPRITKLGSFLRKWKLDELPQLWNVVLGDMSLVGPRPEVPEYVAYYPADVRDLVLSVRPGITDPCSLSLRNESDLLGKASEPHKFYIEQLLPKKLESYVSYVQNHSFISDLRIIFKTISIIAFQRSQDI